MNFSNIFNEFLLFCKDMDLAKPDAKKTYDTITNISKSDKDNEQSPSLVESEFLLLDLDNISLNSKFRQLPATMDALHFQFVKDKPILYFIEFKGESLESIDYSEVLEQSISLMLDKQCNNPERYDCIFLNNTLLNDLGIITKRYEDELFASLKIKPLESYLIALPKAYKIFCEFNGISYEETIDDFILFLWNIKKKIIVVGLDKQYELKDTFSIFYSHYATYNMKEGLNNKYKNLVYHNFDVKPIITNQTEFKELLGSIFTEPLHEILDY